MLRQSGTRLVPCLAVLAASVSGGTRWAVATPVTFTGSSGNLAASAQFEVDGHDLVITLTNTSLHDVLVPKEVLTSLFFDLAGPDFSLTPVSALLNAGSAVAFGDLNRTGDVGGEWAYRGDLVGAPLGLRHGVSSAGFGLFGPHDLFPGDNLEGPVSPNGLQYGITSAGDNLLTGNRAVTGRNALIRNSVVFTLSGLPEGFDPSTMITRVYWQYGTGLDEPGFPEPATASLLALAATVLLRRPMRRRHQATRRC